MPQQTNPQREESAERLARPLIRLANMWGISTSYIDQLGTYVEIEDDVLVTVLKALGVDASSVERIQDALDARIEADATLLAPPTVVKFIGTDKAVELHTLNGEPQVTLTLEDGTMSGDNTFTVERKGAEAAPDAGIDVYELTLTDALPIGYHTLNVTDGERSATAHIICAPARIPVPQAVQDRHRWGWMAQMYSVRSADSWGVGDYGD
ncbi:MAG: 4-alpha-glucanotransferase, partial [Bifidobacterium criceti]|nr:4-alpha-glucanotransferase [Bifidobacterium criceti]